MYVPKWLVHVMLGVAALGLGWFAQNVAAAESAQDPRLVPAASAGLAVSDLDASGAAPADGASAAPTGDLSGADRSAVESAVDSDGSAADTGDDALAVDAPQSPRLSSSATTADVEPVSDMPWGQLLSPVILFGADRTVDIAGYEDHSINVSGRRQIVVYDDSNLFVNRDGKINSNTGDTDSAGLNAVDTIGSEVSSGPHCDDGCDDESIISAEHGHFDEADGGDDDEEDDEEAEDDDEAPDERLASTMTAARLTGSDPSDPRETRDEADTGEEPTTPIDPGGIEIGGDGWDDLAVRLTGEDNVIVTDDSNVVLGGTGPVTAQIGDSDTGGTVTMATLDSTVRGGVSR